MQARRPIETCSDGKFRFSSVKITGSVDVEMLAPLLTPDTVAEYLGISVRDIHALVRRGQLNCIQIDSKRRRFTEEQVSEYLQARTILRPKGIDENASKRLRSPREGGNKRNRHKDSAKALREEMRSWQ